MSRARHVSAWLVACLLVAAGLVGLLWLILALLEKWVKEDAP